MAPQLRRRFRGIPTFCRRRARVLWSRHACNSHIRRWKQAVGKSEGPPRREAPHHHRHQLEGPHTFDLRLPTTPPNGVVSMARVEQDHRQEGNRGESDHGGGPVWCESGAPPPDAAVKWAAFEAAGGLAGWVVCSCRKAWACDASMRVRRRRVCVVCGEAFGPERRGSAKTCGERCSHERRLQTAARHRDRARAGLAGVGA